MEKQDNVCFDCERERVFPLGIIEVAKSRMHGLFSCTMGSCVMVSVRSRTSFPKICRFRAYCCMLHSRCMPPPPVADASSVGPVRLLS